MANLRGNSLVGGKPIVTIDMLNKFVEDIQAAQKDEMMHKYEREVITSNQVVDAYIKDKSKNGVWLCSNVQDFPMYNYGTLLNFSTGSSRLQLYAPHKKASSDKYHDNAGLFFRTGWDSDIKDWQQAASVNYVNDKDNEIKEEINNSLKTEQYLSYEGDEINADNTIESKSEDIKIYGNTICNLIPNVSSNENNILSQAGDSRGVVINVLGKCHYKWSRNQDNQGAYYPRIRIEEKLIKPNTEYTIRFSMKSNTNVNAGFNISYGDAYIGKVNESNVVNLSNSTYQSGTFQYTFTTKVATSKLDGFLYIGFCPIDNNINSFFELSNLVLVEGNVENLPAEYFEEMCSFGEQEKIGDKYKIKLLSHGRNLMNTDELPNNSIKDFSNINGVISGTFTRLNQGTNNAKFRVSKKTKVIIKAMCKGCRIIIKKCWLENEEFREIIDTNNFSNNLNDFVLGTRICYIDQNSEWYVENPHNNNNNKFKIKDICCYNADENLNNYLEYKSCKTNLLLNEPLRKSDFIYQNNSDIYARRFMGEYTFTGDESWTIGVTSSGWGEFADTLVFYLDPFEQADVNTNFICNNFLYTNNININSVGIYNNVWGAKPHPVIRIKKSELQTPNLDGFRQWLKDNPTKIIYKLKEPKFELINSTIDMNLSTFKDKTYFKTENNLKGKIELKVPTNIFSMINNHSENINKLYHKINNSHYCRTILLNEWQKINDAFKFIIKHNLNNRLIANVAATKVDGMSTNIDYKIVDENTIEVYVIDKAQLDIIIKTI